MVSAHESLIAKANQIVQIIAIFVAAVWALWTFGQNTLPGLKTHFSIELGLQSDWFESRDTCTYLISLDIKNKSKRSHEITSVTYHAMWAPYPETPESGEFRIVDFSGGFDEAVKLEYESILAGQYPPDSEYWETFEILSEPVPGEALYVLAEAFNGEDVVGSSGHWVAACDLPGKAEHHKAPHVTNYKRGVGRNDQVGF